MDLSGIPTAEPQTKYCSECLSIIPYRARRCGHCQSRQGSFTASSVIGALVCLLGVLLILASLGAGVAFAQAGALFALLGIEIDKHG
jgi:hypothetical protein